jgi:hypothetical protein
MFHVLACANGIVCGNVAALNAHPRATTTFQTQITEYLNHGRHS